MVVGEVWRELKIEAPWPQGGDDSHTFIAEELRTMKKVVVRACPVVASTEWRRGAWERLCALPELQLVRCLSAEEESGWRYEVSALPPAMTLQEWLACHQAGSSEIEALVRQLAATLGAMHAQGVVHLNIRPSTIFIDESGAEPVFVLGGLQEATLYTQPNVTPSDVDPFYAPPEAAGLATHLPGTRLCAWDWWSVGRVVQEYLLGRHVLGVILDQDVSKPTRDQRTRAELLLCEKAPAGVRAGALDYMTLDTRMTPLLRGLLTGSFEARWGFDAVQRWLRYEVVQDHYDLPRNARLWVYQKRGFTLAEAAAHFTQAGHWDEGEDMLFQPERPETLAAFLAESPAHREDLLRLQAVCDLSETSAWGDVPVVARRTVIAALAWLSLANGSGVRTPLRMRGQAADVVGLAELLRRSGSSTGVALLTALMTPVVINFVEQFDAPAARALKSLAAKGGEAVQHGAQHGWLDPHDQDGLAKIFDLSLRSGALLRESIELLRSLYATNSNDALAALLAQKAPGPRDSVILAYTAESPERHGYITHEKWKRQRCAALKSEAQGIVTILFWQHLRRLLTTTQIWGVPTPYFAGAVLLLTVVSVWLSRSAGPTAAIVALVLLPRVYFWWRVRGMVRRFDSAAGSWAWSDGLSRSSKEATKAEARHALSSSLNEELQRLNGAMADLFKVRKEAPVVTTAKWWDLWGVLVTSTLATVAFFLVLVAQRIPPPQANEIVTPSPHVVSSDNREVPEAPSLPPTLWGVEPPVDIDELVATGRYEVIDDGFGRQLRGPLQKWTFYSGDEINPLEIIARAPASPEQSAFALVTGSLLLQPYPRTGVNVFLALRVPTTRGFGFLIYNTRNRTLLDHEVRLVREPLKDHAWYQLGTRRIGHLTAPAGLPAEISLAAP